MSEPVAIFSDDRVYRYTLWRMWGSLFQQNGSCPRYVNFICLNPSTADETKDDNTSRKCTKYAKAWGFEAMCITNLFAYRSHAPRKMLNYEAPIGPQNDFHVKRIANEAEMIVCAWGQNGGHLSRSIWVLKLLPLKVHILRMGECEPWHPLYLPDDTVPVEWDFTERL